MTLFITYIIYKDPTRACTRRLRNGGGRRNEWDGRYAQGTPRVRPGYAPEPRSNRRATRQPSSMPAGTSRYDTAYRPISLPSLPLCKVAKCTSHFDKQN